MNRFFLVFKHYFMRTLKDKMGLLTQIALPLAIMSVMILINDHALADSNMYSVVNGYNMMHSINVITNLLFFQLFGGMWLLTYLYEDLKESRKFRLLAAPVDKKIFPLAAMLGSFLVSLIQATILIIGTSLLFNVYWGSIPVLIISVMLIALFSQLIFLLIFVFTKTLSQGNGIGFPVIFGIGALSGMFFPLADIIGVKAAEFLFNWGTPLSLARRIIAESGSVAVFNFTDGTYTPGDMSLAIRGIIIFVGINIVIGFISYFAGRMKKLW